MNRRRMVPELEELKDDPNAGGAGKLAKLVRGTTHTRESHIPGQNLKFVWRILSGHQKQAAMGQACKRFQDIGIPAELRSYNDLEDEFGWQVVAMGMRDPEKKGTDASPYPRQLADVDECRQHLTIDERDLLLQEYLDLEEEVDPDPVNTPAIWFEEVQAALKKKPEEAARTLSNLGSRALVSYLLTTVNPQSTSPTGKSGLESQSGTTSKKPNSG